MNKLNIPYIVDAADIDEECYKESNPHKLVKLLSLKKAEAVAHKYNNSIIIGADTVVALKKTILGKPKNKKHALKMLKLLSNKKHFVITGYTILNTKSNAQHTESLCSNVYFKDLSTKEIVEYINSGEPMDKAGAYAIQGAGRRLINKYEGDLNTIIGLPLENIRKQLSEYAE